jgi:hypothetical protein
MSANCGECDRLKQASDDAIRVETMMLAEKFLASSNGYDFRLPKMVALLREAGDLRREARYAFSRHCATHHKGQQTTPAVVEKRMARAN